MAPASAPATESSVPLRMVMLETPCGPPHGGDPKLPIQAMTCDTKRRDLGLIARQRRPPPAEWPQAFLGFLPSNGFSSPLAAVQAAASATAFQSWPEKLSLLCPAQEWVAAWLA